MASMSPSNAEREAPDMRRSTLQTQRLLAFVGKGAEIGGAGSRIFDEIVDGEQGAVWASGADFKGQPATRMNKIRRAPAVAQAAILGECRMILWKKDALHRVVSGEHPGEVAVVADRMSSSAVENAEILAKHRMKCGHIVPRVEAGRVEFRDERRAARAWFRCRDW